MRDAGMSMILDDNSCNSVIRRLIHPEYLMLTEYDRVNNTQLATTMFWFLRCNCSYSNTAEKMDTHRNTVYYRVMKAFEIIDEQAVNTTGSQLLYQLSYLSDHREALLK